MQIFVRTDRTHLIEVSPSQTVADVKAAVEALQGLESDEQRILFNGVQLEDEQVLAEAGVSDDSTLMCMLRLLGGAKKRKKKTYTKPKKQKHKHLKIKLRVLKFYKVDESGKVQRLRKQCPNCGPGTFMATHFDRVYCGKCSNTFVYEGGAPAGAPKPKSSAPVAAAAVEAPAKGKKGKK
ncbi:Ubiquitin-40S ribosomal protein S27a-1 [Tetrabaena socialis]|uniref:Ubiquitin-40S ribosomal protein S27a-1 n=1 Tax=Tetrabaena socialis TaxID=47790 RepID=A0A2J7ZX76_9CHLO|nr:Ubiquitin-40S ribosomal protein S27a-1 [Tetrabaena socialis]|eukprot:PNH04881.1 Ubiquitin-40S ribosomal protein S27a-1 [Tetrabaena socialis]